MSSFVFELPSGFVELPVRDHELTPENIHELTTKTADAFGLGADDDSAAEAAAGLAAFGTHAGASGVDYAAVGFYRSPDDSDRPIMVLVTSVRMASDHQNQEAAVDGLVEIHKSAGHDSVRRLSLPAGPAVAVVSEDPQQLHVGDETIPVLHRRVAAWAPDKAGTVIAVISVSTNSWQDWEHVCRLALDIFESLAWKGSASGSVRLQGDLNVE